MLKQNPVVIVIGTRPEGIKMAPVYLALKRAGIPVIICSTLQHDHLLREVFELFDITPDFDLNIMRVGQDLFYITQSVLQKTKELFRDINPLLVLVQGDTTSSMAASLAAFYLGIPVGHVEAGLRTDDIHAPFPEEMNRRVISVVTNFHFAPTPAAVANILAHGVRREQVFCTGNTVIDALYIVKEKLQTKEFLPKKQLKEQIDYAKQEEKEIAILTLHRRESFNGGIERILCTLKKYVQENPDLFIVYPYHPNPQVVQAIEHAGLHEVENIYLCEPVMYKDMVYLLDNARLVLTDSGGIQEEAVPLGKPVLVLREKTERMEGVLAGRAKIVGTDSEKIIEGINWAREQNIFKQHYYATLYGDGHSAEKIVAFIQSRYEQLCEAVEKREAKAVEIEHIYKKEDTVKKVCVLGLGYIGLPTAIIAADNGYSVIGFDIDDERVHAINSGDPVIREPEIYERLQIVLGAKSFCAKTKIEPAHYFVIAVPTPITKEKTADLSFVFSAAQTIATVLKKNDVVIIESTIPVGASDKVAQFLQEKTNLIAGKDFYVAHCPERVLPGNIFHELVHNDRIIGGINEDSTIAAKMLYKPFVRGCLYLTNAKSAEMVKLIENSSRDVSIAFAHQVASMARTAGINPYEVIDLANKHPRVNILRPTCGVGGHCIAIDPWFLIETFKKETALLHVARKVNDAKPFEVIEDIYTCVQHFNKTNEKQCTVALMGMTYKPDVDDMRESPAVTIAHELIKENNVNVLISEPHIANKKLETLFGNCIVSPTDAIAQADIIVFLVGHQRFKVLNRSLLENKLVIDACGVFHEEKQLPRDHEATFWPAKSVMDFFIDNHEEKVEVKKNRKEQL